MIQRIAEGRLARSLALFGKRGWAYGFGVLAWGVTLAFCFNIVMALVFKDVLNAALEGNSSLLFRGIALSLGTFVLGLPVATAGRYALTMASLRTLTEIRMRFFSTVSRLPMQRLEARHSGDLISRSTNDIRQFGSMLISTLSGFAQAISQGVIGIAAIFALEWHLGLVAVAVGLTSFAVSTVFSRILRKRSDTMQAAKSTMTEQLSNLLSGIQVTRMFQLEEKIQTQFTSAADHAAQQSIAHAHSQAKFDAVQALIGWVQTFGVLSLGLLMFSRGYLLAGAVWAIVHMQGNSSFLFNFFGQFITRTQSGFACGARIREILDLPTEDESGTCKEAPQEAAVALEHVSFTYPEDGTTPTLKDVSLTAKPHSVVAIVGPSGSGKSTLLKLLQGFYLPDEGTLRIGDTALSKQTLQGIRCSTAYVPQDAYLFAGTIRQNLAYGNPDATEDDIVAAARSANAHDFILEQPNGYDTVVGEGGASLSGGQRQRIAIARALLRDAPVLLLDEATSALDSESERLVQDALDSAMKGRTTLAVAHRLSTIQHADKIYVLDDGRIVEQGSHQELVASGRLYQRLHDLQVVGTESAASSPASPNS